MVSFLLPRRLRRSTFDDDYDGDFGTAGGRPRRALGSRDEVAVERTSVDDVQENRDDRDDRDSSRFYDSDDDDRGRDFGVGVRKLRKLVEVNRELLILNL